METTSAARNRPKATARSRAAITGSLPWMASSVDELLQVPGQAGHPLGCRPFDEGVGHRTERTEGLLGL